MILDQIKHAKQYAEIAPNIVRALELMSAYTPTDYPQGRIDVDGEDLYLLLNCYETHSPETALMEAHRQYVDVMYMVQGSEIIYVKPTDNLKQLVKEYDASCDALLAEKDQDCSAIRLEEGQFIVLFPQDAHAPACNASGPCRVKKIIGKVRIAPEAM